MELSKRIEAIIGEPLVTRGYGVVQIQLMGAKRKVLQIMIERLDGQSITVDDCATVSRLVSVLLDVQDPIKDPYILEISSAGLDRPLVKPEDFQRFCGQNVVVTTHDAVEGRKNFQGLLTSADNQKIQLELLQPLEKELFHISLELSNIRTARLFVDFKAL